MTEEEEAILGVELHWISVLVKIEPDNEYLIDMKTWCNENTKTFMHIQQMSSLLNGSLTVTVRFTCVNEVNVEEAKADAALFKLRWG